MSCNCQKCGELINSSNGKMVMVREELWLSLFHKKDILCSTCIEIELGRVIKSSDLKYGDSKFLEKFGTVKLPVNVLFAQLNNLFY